MNWLVPVIAAVRFLTVLPVPKTRPPDGETLGRSVLAYPLVGLLLGGLLAMLLWASASHPALIAATAMVTVWVIATGALHLDGLADSADALIGGLGDRDRTLAILKDAACGPAGVIALILVLGLKVAALDTLITSGNAVIVLLAPVLGRTALVVLFLTTPYVRERGLGSGLVQHMPRRAANIVTLIVLAAVMLLGGAAAFWLILVAAGVLVALRALMTRRIGGATGDTAGALVEITETAVLLAGAAAG